MNLICMTRAVRARIITQMLLVGDLWVLETEKQIWDAPRIYNFSS